MRMKLETMWVTIIMLLTMYSCSVNCNSTTCTGYITDVTGNMYELQVNKQYFNTNPEDCVDMFNAEFRGEIYSVVGRNDYAPVNSCRCSCD